MDALRIETMKSHAAPTDKVRAKAQAAADDFEQMFVRTLVSSLRQTASLGGDGGGMFGSGPGTETYGDWFDQNLAEQIGRDSEIGIAAQVMRDWERHDNLPVDAEAKKARLAADRSFRAATAAIGKGGFDAVL